MNERMLANAPGKAMIARRHLKALSRGLALVAILLCGASARSANDPLKEQFVQRLRLIVDNSDAVVGVAIKNLATGGKFSINENDVFPQASAIKIHILAELYHQAEQGKFRLTDVVPLPSSVRVGGSGVLNELSESGVSMSIRDYAVMMIVLSDNTATNLLIRQVGMENVNKLLN